LERLVSEYFAQLPQVGQSVLMVIDGKTVRGTITREDPIGLHLLSAYLPVEGIVLFKMVVEKDKENKVGIAPQLFKCLDLSHKVVVGDVMQTQRNLSAQIVEAGGEYVWMVKKKQPSIRQVSELLFSPENPVPGLGCRPMDFTQAKTVDKGHGRLDERSISVSSLMNDYLDWPYLAQVFKLERRFTYLATGEVKHEVQYGLTSLTSQEANPKRLLEIICSQSGIENGIHYQRDVTFQEASTRMTHKSKGRVMAIINNLVSGLLAIQGFHNFA
jgi:predicted transposase YbfD/YdcC